MEKLWTGRLETPLNEIADDFNSSLRFDCKMARQDIQGSMAHAAMLEGCGIITKEEGEKIQTGLSAILEEIESGALPFDPKAEDIHTFVEAELTARIGDAGRKLHTARSRNDQVALDLRLYMREQAQETLQKLYALVHNLTKIAEENQDAILPGYTHLQRAQPVTFAQHLLAYSMMFLRDISRLKDALARMNVSPLGACALAGTTYKTDRNAVAKALGFDGICRNSMDAVSDRDYCVELESAFALIMMHLSRLSEEIVLWSSWEFRFIELDDSFTTGSSIMPQKKNPDMAELIRGKTGRVYGDLMATLTVLKGLPLAYNKDMQEDKEAIFDSVETVNACLSVAVPMIGSVRANKAQMFSACQKGFINATDLADYLAKKGMPFRTAYRTVGEIVAECVKKGVTLDELPLSDYKAHAPLFEEDLYAEIAMENCVKKRVSEGGTGYESVKAQIAYVKAELSAK